MGYRLGVDLGTTYTAAAVSRVDASGRVTTEVVPLGTRSVAAPSMLFLGPDSGAASGPETLVVGDAAQRRALTDPDRVVREFKRRIGDETPIMVGDVPYPAESLAARMVRWVVDRVTQREGEAPEKLAVTHPAGWGAHKRRLLAQALTDVDLPSVTFVSEPEAAAVCYAAAERIEPGAAIAVYDLGGGTFDATIVKASPAGPSTGFELLGQPQGIDRLGGVDFDEAVFDHVLRSLAESGTELPELDEQDPVAMSALSRLRRECTEAKEALSADTEATIPVLLLDVRTQVRLVRAEFEDLIRPALEETVDALRLAVTAAGLTEDDLDGVLLVGGSSRIPLVAQLVSDELGRPVSVDADPKTVVALGAALSITPPARPEPAAAAEPAPIPAAAPDAVPIPATAAGGAAPPRPVLAYEPAPEAAGDPPRRRRRLLPLGLAAAASLVIVLAVGGGLADVPGVATAGSAAADTPSSPAPTSQPSATSSPDAPAEPSSGSEASTTRRTANSESPAASPSQTSSPTASPTPSHTTAATPSPTTTTHSSPPPSDPPSSPPPTDPPSSPPPTDPPSSPPPTDPAESPPAAEPTAGDQPPAQPTGAA